MHASIPSIRFLPTETMAGPRPSESTLGEGSYTPTPPGDSAQRPSGARLETRASTKGLKTQMDLEQENASSSSIDDVLVVDWDGPSDPENPKKCVLSVISALLITNCTYTVGQSVRSGPQPWQCHLLPSSHPSRLPWLPPP